MSSRLTSEEKKKVQFFTNTTHAPESTAVSYLEMFSWDLMRAIDEFYANGGDEEVHETANDISEDAVEEWFDTYADPDDEDTIGEDGILKFCEDIAVDPQDIVVLIISWKMNAQTMCTFTRSEWLQGMKALGCDSVEKLKAEIPRIRTFIDNDRSFKSFYSFCFGFSKEPGQKSLSLDIAQAMWELLLSSRFTKMAHWLEFLQTSPCRGITRDTWDLLLDFMVKVEKSYEKYDESEAWPVLIDDFMTWVESNQKK